MTIPRTPPGYLFPGQHFHLYLIAYGLFRLFHEHWRETPLILGPFSGYQIASLALVLLGALSFRARQRTMQLNQHEPLKHTETFQRVAD